MKCPNCKKPVAWQDNPHRPFCSEQCKLIDLSRWVNDEYSVPGEAVTIPEQGQSPAAPATGPEDDW